MTLWAGYDRVTSLEPGKSASALGNVPSTLSILATHFPRFPVLPGVIILGNMGALAARLLEEQTGKRWRLTAAEKVRFRHFVQPGDQMELTVTIVEPGADSTVLAGAVRVRGRLVTTAHRLCLSSLDKE